LLKSDAGSHIDPNGAASPCVVPVPGRQFGDYRILKLLGHGGMGEVYEAEHADTGRRVALKVMRHTLASDQDRKRFLREGRLAASVNHPNVVYIHGSEEIDGAPAIAMELVHGGTLKDKLKHEGPLAIAEATEAALQIIDGLEAAQTAGVLHRDIKPANCFVAADGAVKVGDFGLSVSTLARGESLITATGSVMGTPAYASPEQLRGEELDVTSDIYSVGATLYHLLTGKTPFNATDFVKLITEVLDKQPAPPKSLRPEIPAELSKILLRCLAKDRKARFQTYDELRDALLPFRASEMVAAKPAMRFLAALMDDLIAYMPGWIFITYWSLDPLDKFSRERTLQAALVWLPFIVSYVLYYAVSEGIWGAGIGKTICGLRVVRRDGQCAGLARAALRVLVYSSVWLLPPFLAMATMSQVAMRVAAEKGTLWTEWLWIPLMVLLFITMRARNGYAALQDLASGTRVIVRPKTQPRPALAAASTVTSTPVPSPLTNVGPYAVGGSLWKTETEELLIASDPALRRKVWIRLRPANTAGSLTTVNDARRDLSRAARLRWINGGQIEGRIWDAYEALDGAPFVNIAQQPRPWSAVRFWLLDLAEECAAAIQSPGTAPMLAQDRLWITSGGRAVFLDFPAPGLAAAGEMLTGELADVGSMQKFLTLVSRAALNGSDANPGKTTALVPVHAQSFLVSLARRTFDEARFIVGNLQSLIARPAEVTRVRRFASLAFIPAVALAITGLIVATIAFDRIRWDRDWARSHPGKPSVRAAAELYADRLEEVKAGESEARELELVGSYIVTHFHDVITNESFWASPSRITTESDVRSSLLNALEKFPSPDAQTVAEAERTVPRWIAKRERSQRAVLLHLALGMAVLASALAALVELIGTLGFRVSPLLRLFSIIVVTRSGAAASRLRLLARWALVWIPVAGGVFVCAGVVLWEMTEGLVAMTPDKFSRGLGFGLVFIMVLVADALFIYAVLRPTASLQDRLAGTRLVPV
jgi:uncharacterized RDD family membrane protein YckC/predicted Ser/Thr protein kinase